MAKIAIGLLKATELGPTFDCPSQSSVRLCLAKFRLQVWPGASQVDLLRAHNSTKPDTDVFPKERNEEHVRVFGAVRGDDRVASPRFVSVARFWESARTKEPNAQIVAKCSHCDRELRSELRARAAPVAGAPVAGDRAVLADKATSLSTSALRCEEPCFVLL